MTLLVRKWRLVACLLMVSTVLVTSRSTATSWEIDATATVTRVIDGDTFVAASLGAVRLADIDTPEVGQRGSQEALAFLTALVINRVVHLDVDDLHVTDVYDRLVAVVYVRFNSTLFLNVNKALLDAELAEVTDFQNEFDPASWTMYVQGPSGLTPTADFSLQGLFPVVWMTAVLTIVSALLVASRRNSKL
ncbi:MAG: thermonuclease family protein [Thermoplasmata archaeon]